MRNPLALLTFFLNFKRWETLVSRLAGIWLSLGYNARMCPRDMRGNVPGMRSRYKSHRYLSGIWFSVIVWDPIWQRYDCPKGIMQEYVPRICREMCLRWEADIYRTDMWGRNVPGIWSSLIVWGPIWKVYDCPTGMMQGYLPRLCEEMCQGQEAGIFRTGMLQRYVPGILSSLKVCTWLGLKNSEILNQPNAKDAADLISSDGDEKHSRMATARSLWLLRSLQNTELSLNPNFQCSNVDQETYASVIAAIFLNVTVSNQIGHRTQMYIISSQPNDYFYSLPIVFFLYLYITCVNREL